MQPESANLAYKDIRSDKTYALSLSQCETGWTVMAQFGRRGSTQQVDVKVERSEYEPAKKIYDRVLREKLAKGYKYVESEPAGSERKPAQSTAPTAPTVYAPVSKDIVHDTELLTRISETELKNYLRNDRYLFQVKRDGRRLAVKFDHGQVLGFNKLGQVVQVDPHLRKAVVSLCTKRNIQIGLFDGEWEASGYHVWDMLEMDHDMRGLGYEDRLSMLAGVVADDRSGLIHLVETADGGAGDKGALYLRAKEKRLEGICVKLRSAPYRGGRNGQHYKCKFEQAASFIVGPKPKESQKKNFFWTDPRAESIDDGHRCVALYLYSRNRKRFMATVKIADKYTVPAIGSVIECRYLYAYPNGGIVQPVYFGKLRDDVRPQDCVEQQLKFKAEDAA